MDDLTPKELALRMEGEALLRKVTGQKPGIVGADGAPIVDPEAQKEAEQQQQADATEEAKAAARKSIDAHVAKLRETANVERDAALKTMAAVCQENETAKQCAQVILHAHQLVAWAKLEMQQLDERVDDKALMHLERQIHGAVYSGEFKIASLLHSLRKDVCDFLQERNRRYNEVMRRRKMKVGKVLGNLAKTGFTLPYPELVKVRDESMQGQFGPGQVLILYGPEEALTIALATFAAAHLVADRSQAHYFSAVEVPIKASATMVAASWWRNSLSSVCKFYDTLEPVVESHSTMLVVDDLNLFLLAPETQMAVHERKQRVLTALRQWAVEHAVVIVVGDPVAKEFLKARKYGGLPCAPVMLDEQGCLLIGEEKVKGV